MFQPHRELECLCCAEVLCVCCVCEHWCVRGGQLTDSCRRAYVWPEAVPINSRQLIAVMPYGPGLAAKGRSGKALTQ